MQTDLTSTLRPANRAVPYGCVASNALAYTRPCLQRIPKALPPRISTNNTENIGHIMTTRWTYSMGRLIANTSGVTIASTNPIASTGTPLDFRSNHICARVADEVGHGNRNRLMRSSENPGNSISGA